MNVALQYQAAYDGDNDTEGTNNSRGTRHQNGDGFSMSSTYDFGMGINS